MSGYYYSDYSPQGDGEFDFNQPYPPLTTDSHQPFPAYAIQGEASPVSPQQSQHPYHSASQYYAQAQLYQQQQQMQYSAGTSQAWSSSIGPSSSSHQAFSQPGPSTFPSFPDSMGFHSNVSPMAPSQPTFFPPKTTGEARAHRSTSLLSDASSFTSPTESDVGRSISPNASEMAKWGKRNDSGSWSCAYPGCTSRSTFNRGCDLRKHYKRHNKSLFCRVDGCPQATEGGFSSKKDRARHEAKHNPSITCEWEGCDRLFSRHDNMKDHVRRVHQRRAQ